MMKIISATFAALTLMARSASGCEEVASLDAYILIDVSSSMEAHIDSVVVPLASTLAEAVRIRKARGSVVVFGRYAKLAQPLTDQPEKIENSLEILTYQDSRLRESGTNIGAALDLVSFDEISSEKTKLVVIVTDGRDSPERDDKGRLIPFHSIMRAQQLRSAGVRIVVISLAPDTCANCEEHLKRVASEPAEKSFFPLASSQGSVAHFSRDSMNVVLGYICAQMSSASPLRFCNPPTSSSPSNNVVSVVGNGFLGGLQCRFEEIEPIHDQDTPTTDNSKNCVDTLPASYPKDSCAAFAAKAYCLSDSPYAPFMALHCARTCGLCTLTVGTATSNDGAITATVSATVLSDNELLCTVPTWNGDSVRHFRLTLTGAGASHSPAQLLLTGIPCGSDHSVSPTGRLTPSPSSAPSANPSASPTALATASPSVVPTVWPSARPSAVQTVSPTLARQQTLPPFEADGDEMEALAPHANEDGGNASADFDYSVLLDSTFEGCPDWLQNVDSYRRSAEAFLYATSNENSSDSAPTICYWPIPALFLGAAGCLALLTLALCLFATRTCCRRCRKSCRCPRKVHRRGRVTSIAPALPSKSPSPPAAAIDFRGLEAWRLAVLSEPSVVDEPLDEPTTEGYTFESDSFDEIV